MRRRSTAASTFGFARSDSLSHAAPRSTDTVGSFTALDEALRRLDTEEMIEGMHVGAYRVLSLLGAGGMGEVWLAEHAMLGRRAAVKVLHPSFSSRPEIVTRFFNEARAATAIADPGIVQIFDFGHHVDGSAYIVMELLEGEPLDKRLHRHGALSLGEALRIMRQVASSLGAAHARGIVHRDLKPENIFLVRDPEVPGGERAKILDFGIAKLVGDQVGPKTQTSALMGTPAFMSPEQCRGAGQVDQRSDVYSLGCVLFTLITGRPPFDAEGAGEIIAMHLREPPPSVSSRVPTVPAEVDQMLGRCLAKDPNQRFASAAALAATIESVLALPAFGGSFRMTPAGSYAAPMTTLSSTASQLERRPSRRGSVVAVLALGVLAAAGAGIWFVTRAPAVMTTVSPAGSATVPVAASPPSAVDEATKRITKVLAAFGTWSKTHGGAACPTAVDLAAVLGGVRDLDDAWGRTMSITCTDQPADQIIGVVSSGPDGTFGTRDDVRSWTLGFEVTDLVQGSRWVPAAIAATASAPTAPTTKPEAGAKSPLSATASKETPKGKRKPAGAPTPPPANPIAQAPEAPVEPPAPAPTADGIPAKLDRTMIADAVGKVRKLIDRCGETLAGGHGKVVVLVTVEPSGQVKAVEVGETTDSWLGDCVSSRIKRAVFPATTSGGTFRWPFTF